MEGCGPDGGHGHGKKSADDISTVRRGSLMHSPVGGARRLSVPTLTSGQEAKHVATTANSSTTPVASLRIHRSSLINLLLETKLWAPGCPFSFRS